jgi:hypothetical protein
MSPSSLAARRLLPLALAWLAVLARPAGADGDPGYEVTPQPVTAAEVLRTDVLQGPHHKVRQNVVADDFLYRFEMESDYGLFTATGKRMAAERAKEVEAIARLLAMDGGGEAAKALAGRLKALPTAAVELVKDPVGSVEAMGQGVGRTLGRVGDFFGSRKATAYEGQAASGADDALFGADRRKLAFEMDVDPYSTNPKLQTCLTEIARARRAGTFGVDLAGMAVPGGAGIALSVVKMRDDVKGLLRDHTPAELDRLNDEKLAKRGVPAYLRREFAAARALSPSHRTAIAVGAERLEGVSEVGALIAASLTATDEAHAMFQAQQAALLAYQHVRVEPVKSLDVLGTLVVATLASGRLAVYAPVDFVSWTPAVEKAARGLLSLPAAATAPSRDLYLTGKASPRAAAALQAMGFTLREGFVPR